MPTAFEQTSGSQYLAGLHGPISTIDSRDLIESFIVVLMPTAFKLTSGSQYFSHGTVPTFDSWDPIESSFVVQRVTPLNHTSRPPSFPPHPLAVFLITVILLIANLNILVSVGM